MFTDVEMAILSQLAYQPYPPPPASLHDHLTSEENLAYLKKELGPQYKDALNSLIEKTENYPYTIVAAEEDPETGFAAFAVADADKRVTTACRGTELNKLFKDPAETGKDAWADLSLVSEQTGQQEKMQEFVRRLEQAEYSEYSFTGHSLGGNLAMYGSIVLQDKTKLNKAVVYNAPGFSEAFWSKHKDQIDQAYSRITAYQNELDGVSDAFMSPGNVIVLEYAGSDVGYDGFSGHFLKKFKVNADGTSFDRCESGTKKITALGLSLFGLTLFSDGVSTLSPTLDYTDYMPSKNSGQTIKVPLATLQDHARTMRELTDTNADIFDRVYNSLQHLKDSGLWQGKSIEAVIAATELNKKKFAETIAEMKTLADFLNKFTTQIAEKDTQIKNQIISV